MESELCVSVRVGVHFDRELEGSYSFDFGKEINGVQFGKEMQLVESVEVLMWSNV
jgi:hypothetical protein